MQLYIDLILEAILRKTPDYDFGTKKLKVNY